LALLGSLLIGGTDIADAVSIKVWKDFAFFGSTKSAIHKALGKPQDPGDMDTYVISDSPDFMMFGLIGYDNGKVAAVCAVLQPKLTYEKVRDIQLQAEAVKFVAEDNHGVLFKYKQPRPNGPNFIAIAPPDDKQTGPMFIESIANPFAGAVVKKTPLAPASPAAAKTAPARPQVDWSVLDKDVFDWQLLDDKAKLALLTKIKILWRAGGAETDRNAIDARMLLKKSTFPSNRWYLTRRAKPLASIRPPSVNCASIPRPQLASDRTCSDPIADLPHRDEVACPTPHPYASLPDPTRP